FITSSSAKFAAIKQVIPQVEQVNLDLQEIQELDPHKVIAAKVRQAFEHHKGPILVDDTSLTIEGLGGLPGPFVKWFEQAMGLEGVYRIAKASGNTKAVARCILGYAENPDSVRYFEGVHEGRLVEPRGHNSFGWDPLFLPDGHKQTFGEMTSEKKDAISHRKQAAEQLLAALG
ncbi:MAG TPA: non-canonical purine NTP pyrophosphatase, partial [Candidatus Polarisedimenticolaceae bacterium]|nr:non-canonical purine NTP pyrophosphatase [Candidatus Polarisedimenticolaceae bacterium]